MCEDICLIIVWWKARYYVRRGLSYRCFLYERWDRCNSAFYVGSRSIFSSEAQTCKELSLLVVYHTFDALASSFPTWHFWLPSHSLTRKETTNIFSVELEVDVFTSTSS